jgi:hypothetical protein
MGKLRDQNPEEGLSRETEVLAWVDGPRDHPGREPQIYWYQLSPFRYRRLLR